MTPTNTTATATATATCTSCNLHVAPRACLSHTCPDCLATNRHGATELVHTADCA